jgi:hypothetical protein
MMAKRDGRFAATGLTYQAMRLTAHHREIEVDDRGRISRAPDVGHR